MTFVASLGVWVVPGTGGANRLVPRSLLFPHPRTPTGYEPVSAGPGGIGTQELTEKGGEPRQRGKAANGSTPSAFSEQTIQDDFKTLCTALPYIEPKIKTRITETDQRINKSKLGTMYDKTLTPQT